MRLKHADIIDPITRAPDLASDPAQIVRSRAWLANLDEIRTAHKIDPAEDASIAFWVLEAPWAHPLWHHYIIVLIHLRPVAGSLPPANIYLPGASHEIIVHALDPQLRMNEWLCTMSSQLIDGKQRSGLLAPANFAAQFIADDLTAKARVAATVAEICALKLSPDTDYTSQWIERYGDNMVRK